MYWFQIIVIYIKQGLQKLNVQKDKPMQQISSKLKFTIQRLSIHEVGTSQLRVQLFNPPNS